MRILIATDSFPPGCGGSGWSTFELARGLRARGHSLAIVQPRPGGRSGTREYGGFLVRVIGAPAPAVPYVRNYFKNERLAARLAPLLAEAVRTGHVDVIHAQHVLTAPASVAAARQAGIPSVCTVRDYWPVCYWSDLIYDRAADSLCPSCTPGMMTRCVRPRAGAVWPLALPMIPYMRANLARKRLALASSAAVVAVSTVIGADLLARAPELAATRVEVIPNPVDVEAIHAAAREGPRPSDGPYALFVGKLAPNKGVSKLVPAAEHARLPWPLVVIGDGPDRGVIETAARRTGRDVRLLGWLPREATLGWMARASLLVFPSYGPESLSRVLLESAALALPIAAMDTGGTRDIVIDGETGLLTSTSAAALGEAVARLVADRTLASRLAAGARAHVEAAFGAAGVAERIERLYGDVIATRRGGARTDPSGGPA